MQSLALWMLPCSSEYADNGDELLSRSRVMEVVHCADHNLLTRYEHKGNWFPSFELRFGIIDEITVTCNRTAKVCQPTAVTQSLHPACISLTRGHPAYLPRRTLIIVSFSIRSTSSRGTCLSASVGSDPQPTWGPLTFYIDITTSARNLLINNSISTVALTMTRLHHYRPYQRHQAWIEPNCLSRVASECRMHSSLEMPNRNHSVPEAPLLPHGSNSDYACWQPYMQMRDTATILQLLFDGVEAMGLP
ncbi:hypothetical protein BDV19DRAFT_36341 [Aspergillus venezuelensis]